MSETVDQQRDVSNVKKYNCFTGNHSNISKKTTNGWQFLIEWNDETKTQVYIKYVKKARPIDLAKYAVENNIANKP